MSYMYVACNVMLSALQELAQLCSQLAARRVFKSGLSVLSLDDFSAAQVHSYCFTVNAVCKLASTTAN
jgi:hypothetical protein